MRAVVFDRVGDPADVLAVKDVAVPEPGWGEVRVRMLASPVNPSDLMYVRGVYGLKPTPPATPGFEGVGIVEKAGGGLVAWLRKGKRVAVLNDRGNWSEFTVVPATRVIPVPDDLPDDQAAGFFVNPVTAYVLTRKLVDLPTGAWLLQTAAGGAVGRMVIRLGKKYGFRTFNIVRRVEQVTELLSLGADAVFTEDRLMPETVNEVVGAAGLRYAIDPVGGDTGTRALGCLSAGGRLVLYVSLTGEPIRTDPRFMLTGGIRVEGFWLADWMNRLSIPKKLRLVRRVRALASEGVFTSGIGRTFRLEDVRTAVAEAERPGKPGKVLLTFGSGA